MNIKKTNIFMKNLLESVDEEQVSEVFKQFGEITSVAVKSPSSQPANISAKTKFAFVNFKTE